MQNVHDCTSADSLFHPSFTFLFFLLSPSIILMRVFCVASHAACSIARVPKRSRSVDLSFFSVCGMHRTGWSGVSSRHSIHHVHQQHDLFSRSRSRTSTCCLCSLAICFSRRSTCACDLCNSLVRSLFLLSNFAISSAFSAPAPKKASSVTDTERVLRNTLVQARRPRPQKQFNGREKTGHFLHSSSRLFRLRARACASCACSNAS